MGNCGCFSTVKGLETNELTTEHLKDDAKAVYENIIKIQPNFRGYLGQKSYDDEGITSYNEQVVYNLKKFASTHLKSRLKELSPYTYNSKFDGNDLHFENRLFRPISEIPNNEGIYIGEWYGIHFILHINLFTSVIS